MACRPGYRRYDTEEVIIVNCNLVEIELDVRALEFIKESLGHATGIASWKKVEEQLPDGSVIKKSVPYNIREDSLAHHVLKREDLADGKVIACMHKRAPQEALYRFRAGVKLKAELSTIENLGEETQEWRSVPEEDTYFWLVRVVMEYLRGGPDRVCMFDSVITSRSEPWIAKLDSQPHTFQNQVYFALFHKDADSEERVASAIGNANNAWFFYGVMSSLPAGGDLDPAGAEITSDVLEILAQRTEKIVVSAYDGESYLIWSKPAT